MKHFLLFAMALLSTLTMQAQETQLAAFPGADGYAKYVTGGRGGKVYYVTRTDDCPDDALVEGTLRWALNGGDDSPRTVLFATNGTIYLTSKLKMKYNNVSILGQSAPGGGVCLAGYPLNICKNNVIVRYIRFRAGDVPNQSYTGLSMENCKNVILDHCSMTWSMEECLTAYDSDYTTVQWCIIGEGLYNSKNSKGSRAYATQWGGEHSTMHHTLITNSHSRSPRFNGVRVYENQSTAKGHDYQVDSEFANNVIYNWSTYNAIYGGEMSGKFDDQYNRVYLINNYYRPGPSTKRGTSSKRYWVAASAGENSTGSVTAPGQWYVNGNKFELSSKWAPSSTIWSDTELQKVNDDNLYGHDQNLASRAMGYWSLTPSATLRARTIMETLPYELSGMEYESADNAFANVTTKAGASLPRYDEVDARLLAEAAGTIDPQFIGSIGGGEYGIIDSPDNVTLKEHDTFVANGTIQTNYPFLGMHEGDKYAIDTDADGMPDAYETAVGLNPNDPNDGATVTSNGYTNLENYLNGIADGTINKALYETSTEHILPGSSTPQTANFKVTFSNSDADVEGIMPAVSEVKNGMPVVLPAATFIYKEGYTFTAWQCDGISYAAGGAFVPTSDVVITPVFTKNDINLADRKATTVNITWDFTAADAPQLSSDKQGVYTTKASISVTNPATVIDARIKFNGYKLSIPSDKGAKIVVSYIGGTSETITASSADALYEYTANSSAQLKNIEVTLPKVSDGVYYYEPSCAVDASEVFYPTAESVSQAAEWMETNSSTYENATALDPVKDDGTSTIETSGLVLNGTTSTATKLTFKVTGVKQLRLFATTAATNATVKTTPTVAATPNDGSAAIIAKSATAVAGTNSVIVLNLDPNIGYTVTVNCSGDSRGRFILSAIKMVKGERTEVIPGTDPEPEPEPEPDKHDIFNAAPYDAQVWDANELLEALTAAKNRSDKTVRYRIFMHNGTYDLGTKYLTAVPQATSLIGESKDGVIVVNKPANAGSSATPTLYIDQNQTDTYFQDMTIRQGRDWDSLKSTGQAMAMRQRASRAAFKNVVMQGIQDTYYLNKSGVYAYLEDCDIYGQTDFIYGDGTAWLEHCYIYNTGAGYITAPNTAPGVRGIVISNSTIDGTSSLAGRYYLGRPWGSGTESPEVTYLNNTFRIKPADAGWAKMTDGMVIRFHEYGSKDANGNALDLSKRTISACNGAAGSHAPVLTAAEAAEYTLSSTFIDWEPQALTAQLTAPDVVLSGNTLQWNTVDGAFAYAVCRNGSVVAFTTTPSYNITIPGTYTIRVANQMGGLGEPSKTSVDGISSVLADNGLENAVAYNLAGQRIMPSMLGNANRIIIVGGKKVLCRK